MPYLQAQDLETHLYPELIKDIIRGNQTLLTQAIDTAVQEAKSFLSRYDVLQLFGDENNPPQVTDAYLQNLVKDLAVWHLLRVSNTGVDLQLYRTAYSDAMQAFNNIMAGLHSPAWPYAATANPMASGNDGIAWSSNPKRNNYY